MKNIYQSFLMAILVLMIMFIIFAHTGLKTQNDKISNLKNDLTIERNVRFGMYNELLETQKEVFKEDIEKADKIIKENYDVYLYKSYFNGLDKNGFLIMEYWKGGLSKEFKVNPNTNTILITN